MRGDTEHYLRELMRISLKIDKRKFNTFQEADKLIKQQTDLIMIVLNLLHDELYSRGRRYYRHPFDFDAW